MPRVKDMLGVPVDIGDIVLSCAATSRGLAKLGRVYGFNRNGYPMVEYMGKKYNLKTGKYEDAWQRGEAGSHVLVLGYPSGDMPKELVRAIRREYPSDTSDSEGRDHG